MLEKERNNVANSSTHVLLNNNVSNSSSHVLLNNNVSDTQIKQRPNSSDFWLGQQSDTKANLTLFPRQEK